MTAVDGEIVRRATGSLGAAPVIVTDLVAVFVLPELSVTVRLTV